MKKNAKGVENLQVQVAKLGEAFGAQGCYDCKRSYGDEHGFPDLVVPHDV